jgi:hypothetical protein
MRTLRWAVLPLLAAITGLMGGCGVPQGGGDVTTPSASSSGSTPSGSTTPSGSGTSSGPATGVLPPVTITRRGGLAGVDETVAISADGSWVYTNRRQVTTQRGTLTDAQRRALAQLVTSPDFLKQVRATPGLSNCNDAFAYAVVVGDLQTQLVDCGTTDRPAVKAVITAVVNDTPL